MAFDWILCCCYLVSLGNIWDLKVVLTAWNIPLLCFSPLAQNRSAHCHSREHEKSQEWLGIFFWVYISLEGSKMVRGTGDLSNLTRCTLKYYVRIKTCMNSHMFSKDSNTRSQIAVRLAAGIFCFSPLLGEISWFLKMVSRPRYPFSLSGCHLKQALKSQVTAGQSDTFSCIRLCSSLSPLAHLGVWEPTKIAMLVPPQSGSSCFTLKY